MRLHPAASRHRQACRRDAGAVDRVRRAAHARRRSHRAAFERTARGAGEAVHAVSPTRRICACRPRPRGGPRPRAGWRGPAAARSTASSPSASTSLIARASGRCSRSSACARPTASSAASATPPAAKEVGSLLLGLYDDQGLLDHVGFTSAISDAERPALTRKLDKLRGGPGFTGDAPGGPSRWSTERSSQWEPLSPSWSSRCSTIT